jgi:hypothetical protein
MPLLSEHTRSGSPGSPTRRQLRWWIVLSLVLAAVSIVLSLSADLEGSVAGAVRYAVAGLSVVVIGFWGRAAFRFQRSLDEMQRRVFLEVTSAVGIAAIAWLYLFPVLEKTGIVGPVTHDGYAMVVLPLSLIAWLVVVRRYQ